MSHPDPPPLPLEARRAFDELGRIALRDHSMESMLQRVAELAKNVVPGAAEVSVTLVNEGMAQTAVFTGDLALALDESQYERGYGPCLGAAAGGEVVLICDARTETRWPGYTRDAVGHGSLSSLSTPIPVQKQVTAALNIYGLHADAFDSDSRQLAATFASYAAVAVANMHLYESNKQLAEQLSTAMQSRAVIDQAKGILMAERRITAEKAFDLLVDLSQHTNRKLREVAQALVEQAAAPRD